MKYHFTDLIADEIYHSGSNVNNGDNVDHDADINVNG